MAEWVDFFEKKCEFRAPMVPFGGEGSVREGEAPAEPLSGR